MGYRTPTCPIARSCGGCEWLSVPYPIQLKRKQQQVVELLGPLGEKFGVSVEDIRGMREPRAFRHKAATPFAPGARGRVRSGFYAAGTHRIVACEACLVEDPRARDILNDVARLASRFNVRAYDEDRGRGTLRHAVIRTGYATDEMLLTLVANGQRLPHEREFISALQRLHPEITGIVLNVNQRRTNAILGRETRVLAGAATMHDKLLNCTFEIGPTSFYQTNPEQTEVLYRLALEGVFGVCEKNDDERTHDGGSGCHTSHDGADSLSGGSSNCHTSHDRTDSLSGSPLRILDTYCGTGTIGICATKEADSRGIPVELIGVDQVENNITMAKRNARANAVSARFICDDATRFIAQEAKRGASYDVVVLDPPRAGSTPTFLKVVEQLAPKRVVYVSCNVVTQARDLEVLLAGGYKPERIIPVDMFPHTKHVETVVLLSHKAPDSHINVKVEFGEERVKCLWIK